MDYYTQFQSKNNELLELITIYRSSTTEVRVDLRLQFSFDLQALRKILNEGTEYMAPYDRRTCEEHLRISEEYLDKLRQEATAKPKFSFKKNIDGSPQAKPVSEQPSSLSEVKVVQEPSTTSLCLRSKSREYLTLASFPDLVNKASDASLFDLDHCFANLMTGEGGQEVMDYTAIHAQNIKDSVLIIGSVNGSVMLHGLERCTVVIKCHQLRIHDSRNLHIYVDVPRESSAIIENCSGVAFANYHRSLDSQTPLTNGNPGHLQVKDFSHIKDTPSPNWSQIPEHDILRPETWLSFLNGGAQPSKEWLDDALNAFLPPRQEPPT